jgi:thiamine pyrophosphate-dependent acetolactate synthase large subunit-like protein
MARGAFPDSHPQHMGMPGMHGTVGAVGALQKADLIVALADGTVAAVVPVELLPAKKAAGAAK